MSEDLGLDEFFEWFGQEQRPGFTKATVSAWRVALEARWRCVKSMHRANARWEKQRVR